MVQIQTSRLTVEPLVAGHADDLAGLLDHRVNLHFAPEDVPDSLSALRQQFADMEATAIKGYCGARFLPLVVKTSEDEKPIGRIEALVHGKDAEIAYILLLESWGKGFASEAIAALIANLRDEGVERVWACVTPGNKASIKLCRRLAFRRRAKPCSFSLATYDDGDVILSLGI